MDELKSLGSLGFTLPSPAYIAAAIVFGIIGFAAYRYGKKTARVKVKVDRGGAHALPVPYFRDLVALYRRCRIVYRVVRR